MITAKEQEFINLIESLPVSANDYYDYLKYNRYTIKILLDRDITYGHLELIYERYREVNNVSYKTFLKYIKKGEECNLWGVYTVNRYKVLYLKRNAFKLYLNEDKTGTIPDRISTEMLARSVLKLSIKFKKLIKINNPYCKNLYLLVNNDNNAGFVNFSLSDSVFTNEVKQAQPLRTYLMTNKEFSRFKNIIVLSPYSLKKSVVDNFNLNGFKIKHKCIDVLKYFNNLPIK